MIAAGWWPWGRHRRFLESLHQEISDAQVGRRAAERTLAAAREQQAASRRVCARSDQAAALVQAAVEENHFTELLRAAMRGRD